MVHSNQNWPTDLSHPDELDLPASGVRSSTREKDQLVKLIDEAKAATKEGK